MIKQTCERSEKIEISPVVADESFPVVANAIDDCDA